MTSPNQRPLPDNIQHSKKTDIRAPSGIRTRNPSKREVVDLRLRPHNDRDRLLVHYLLKISFLLHAKDVLLIFYPEEGGDMLLRKVGIFFTDCKALCNLHSDSYKSLKISHFITDVLTHFCVSFTYTFSTIHSVILQGKLLGQTDKQI
jgi:hypothetical protein